MNRAKVVLLCLSVSILSLHYCLVTQNIFCRVLLVNTTLSALLLALAYGFEYPRIFFKRPDGRIPFWSYILHWPYMCFNFITFIVFQWLSRETAYNQAARNLFIGRLLISTERQKVTNLKIINVLDLTCEFPEASHFREASRYLCLPVLDTLAPSLSQLQTGVDWLEQSVQTGPTYVHCALGHGRSATVIVGFILNNNPDITVDEAVGRLSKQRPGIYLQREQVNRLRQFKRSLSVGQ